mmetsp:Transcript_7606/g.16487  ORF Transcript_7606/g.16487 Transcript_7606/m.16487 type:complete len:91 (+) Transcript_7606:418-690(+)
MSDEPASHRAAKWGHICLCPLNQPAAAPCRTPWLDPNHLHATPVACAITCDAAAASSKNYSQNRICSPPEGSTVFGGSGLHHSRGSGTTY